MASSPIIPTGRVRWCRPHANKLPRKSRSRKFSFCRLMCWTMPPTANPGDFNALCENRYRDSMPIHRAVREIPIQRQPQAFFLFLNSPNDGNGVSPKFWLHPHLLSARIGCPAPAESMKKSQPLCRLDGGYHTTSKSASSRMIIPASGSSRACRRNFGSEKICRWVSAS